MAIPWRSVPVLSAASQPGSTSFPIFQNGAVSTYAGLRDSSHTVRAPNRSGPVDERLVALMG